MDPLRFGPLDEPDTAPRAARCRLRGRRLRQLPRPAEHRRRGGLRPQLPRQPAGQRPLRRRAAARGPAPGQGHRRGQPGDPLRRRHRRRRHRRGLDPRVGDLRRRRKPSKRPAVQVGDPFMEKLLIECTLELFAAGVVTGIQDFGAAGISCATSELAAAGDGGMHVELDRVPLRDSSLAPEEILMSESQERMMAVVEPGDVERVPRDLRQVGRAGDGRRRGHRGRPAGHRVARRDRRRRRPAHRRPRGPGLRAPLRPARVAGRGPGRRRRARWPGPRPATSSPRPCCGWSARPTSATSPGSPTSTTATSAATPSWPSPRTPGCCGSTRRPASASRCPPTATAASRCSTPTPARSWRWPRPTATSPSRGAQPVAVSDCLNFGSPEDPAIMWQFTQADRRAGGRLQGPRHAGDRWQRQLLQPDGHDADPARRPSSA